MINPSEIIIDKAMRLIARGLAANRLKTVASGLEHIPAQGPALIVARHYHHLFDGLALFAALPRRFHIVVTLDWARNKPTKFFFETIDRLARWPIVLRGDASLGSDNRQQSLFTARDVIRYDRVAVRQSVDLLVDGRLLVIFPEGYPNIDPVYTPKTEPDQFLPFKPGFVNIVGTAEKRAGRTVPIVPAGLYYTQGAPWTAHLRFGAPIYLDRSRDKKNLIDTVERAVKKLSAKDE